MNIERIDTGPITILRLDGDLDDSVIDLLRGKFHELAAEGRFTVAVNLSEVRFISYHAVGVLAERHRKFHALNGELRIVNPNLYAQRLFRIVGIAELWRTFPTEQEALAAGPQS